MDEGNPGGDESRSRARQFLSSSENRNLLVSLAAALIALASLAVSVWQGLETRQHYRLSVQPRLRGMWIDTGDDAHNRDVWEWRVFNVGSGIAYMAEVNLTCDDSIIVWSSLAPHVVTPEGRACHARHGIVEFVAGAPPHALSPSDTITVVSRLRAAHQWVQDSPSHARWIAPGLDALGISVTYGDIYGERFSLSAMRATDSSRGWVGPLPGKVE